MTWLNLQLSKIGIRLTGIPPKKRSLFFLSCAERLFPLYKDFNKTNKFGSILDISVLLEKLWNVEIEIIDQGDLVEFLNKQVPDAEQFDDTILCTFAQDFCICVSSAISARFGGQVTQFLEFTLESQKISAFYEKTGYIDPGSANEDVFKIIEKDARISKEIQFQHDDIDMLESHEFGTNKEVLLLRERSCARGWNFKDLLPLR